jgi:hypothetical protein
VCSDGRQGRAAGTVLSVGGPLQVFSFIVCPLVAHLLDIGAEDEGSFEVAAVRIFIAKNFIIAVSFHVIRMPLVVGGCEHECVISERAGGIVHPD